MSPVTLRFLGCGDAFSAGGRLHTSFYLDGGGEPLLIDCGATTLVALKRLGLDSTSIGHVVLSHLHGDHFGGLPWLIIDGQFNGRRKPLVIAGPQRTEERFLAAFDALYPGAPEAERPFAVSVVEISERVRTEIGPAAVTTFGVIHTPAAFPHALRIEYGGKVIAYSGDTEWTDVLLEVADAADLFVCECQEYERSVPGHLNYMTLREKRPQFRCRRLVINHMGATMLARLDELDVEAAEDGLAIEV